MEKIRVLVADDHPTFREGLIRALAEQNDMKVVGQAGNGEEVLNLVSLHNPDVVVMDVSMPELNGIQATRSIKESSPNTAVLIVSAFDYQPYILGAIEAGASGYILKNVRVWDLVAAIRTVYGGETVLDSTVVRKVFSQLSHAMAGNIETSYGLRQREIEVLKLAAAGMSNKEIGSMLSLSVRTVQAHLTNIYGKLGVGSRTEAILFALKEGWFTLDDIV